MNSIYHNPGDAVVQIPDLQFRAGKKFYPLSWAPGEVKDLAVVGLTAEEIKASGQLTQAVKTGLLKEGGTFAAPVKIPPKDAVGADGTVTPKETHTSDPAEAVDLTKMTKKQLIALAQSRGIDVDEKLPNKELIKLITATEQADEPPVES